MSDCSWMLLGDWLLSLVVIAWLFGSPGLGKRMRERRRYLRELWRKEDAQ